MKMLALKPVKPVTKHTIREHQGRMRRGTTVVKPPRPSTEPYMVITTVTPEIAAQWLEATDGNRSISSKYVEKLSRDMLNGKFWMNGDSIRFSVNGKLIDGHHRLWAILMGNVSLRLAVTYNIPTEAKQTIDTGRSRTYSDVLALLGTPYYMEIANTATFLYRWDTGDAAREAHPTNAEREAAIAKHPALPASAATVKNSRHLRMLAPITAMVFVHTVLTEHDPVRAKQFFGSLAEPLGLSTDDPIWILRERLTTIRGQRTRPGSIEIAALIIKGYNAWVQQRSIQVVTWRRGESFPQIATG